ncbi:hypothetical protein Poli38472_000293 [Pythium oligandrum]|uniref:DUF547 domain-containing protein n=1 Tax=Pythium oligandrum TaxID=41045 RepID=A0A8K1CC66_PYTOL|nr:hypothetical protein Poli38472_000293 [Pythium oligandrum]|eukprot:TMW60251.1 hypothetical protein Poli38472_000293 [Pythium oligandrum]
MVSSPRKRRVGAEAPSHASHATVDAAAASGDGDPAHPPRSQVLAILTSIVLVILVVLELVTDPEEVREWRFSMLSLVFPSRQVTWLKIVCVTLGFCLSSSYFLGSRSQLAAAEQTLRQSAAVLVSPFASSHEQQSETSLNHNGTPTASWLASRCQSLLRTDHFGASDQSGEELPQLKIRDECRPNDTPVPLSTSSQFESVNPKHAIPFESEYFQGHYLFMVRDTTRSAGGVSTWGQLFNGKRRTLWVQIQGRFKKPLPPRCVIYLATELPNPRGFQVAFLTRQLVTLLITLVKKFVPTAHISFGDERSDPAENELPHAAFPLYQNADEFVVTSGTDAVPVLGQECFGETRKQKETRSRVAVGQEPPVQLDAVYSFQFHTMYADLAQWKMVNVPGMPDMDLKRFCSDQPIHIAGYAVNLPVNFSTVMWDLPHCTKDKNYFFSFSVHRNLRIQPGESKTSATSSASEVTSPMALSPSSTFMTALLSPRWRSVSCDQPEALVRQQQAREEEFALRPQPRIRASSSVRNMTPAQRAADLANWKFSLPFWLERVDAAAGNRKVAYIFQVQPKSSESPNPKTRTVVRTTSTVKHALLLLDNGESGEVTPLSMAYDYKKLVVESREYLYDTITRETNLVGRLLQEIAALPVSLTSEEQQAMLYNCLMSASALPRILTYQDIGVQLTKSKRKQMDIILELGVYRMMDRRFFRQEWFILTTSEVLFFRSFSLRPGKSISITQILHVECVDDLPFLCDDMEDEPEETTRRATNRWFCLQLHLLNEIVTVFLDSEQARSQSVSSLNQLIKLKRGSHHQYHDDASGALRLPSLVSIDSVSSPVCLNHRSYLPARDIRIQSDTSPSKLQALSRSNGLQLAEETLRRGLVVAGKPRENVECSELMAFFSAIEHLNDLVLMEGGRLVPWLAKDEDRMAFALNLYHILYIHARLLYGSVSTHAQWKKFKTLPYYTLGSDRAIHLSLADIEYGLLRARPGPGDERLSSGLATNKARTELFSRFVVERRDFRTSLALQMNCGRATASLMRVYHAGSVKSFQDELNETCAQFLQKEVRIDDTQRVIHLPKVCEWNADDYGTAIQVPAGSRGFFCLQKLLPLMHAELQEHVQHQLLGAGKECQIRYSRFWTQELTKSFSSSLLLSRPDMTATVQPTTRSRDDSTLDAVPGAENKGSPIPKSTSALDFLQSLF